MTREELTEVAKAIEETGGKIQVGFNRRFAPTARAAREFMAQVPRQTMLYRINAGPLPSGHWLRDPAQGGGRLVGEGCHFIDFLHFLCAARPERVHARALGGGAADAGDSFMLDVAMNDGSIGSILYTAIGDSSFPKERIETFGGGRVAVIDDFKTGTLVGGGSTRKMGGSGSGQGAEGADGCVRAHGGRGNCAADSGRGTSLRRGHRAGRARVDADRRRGRGRVVNAAAPSGALPLEAVLAAVWADAEAADFAGWDPYDGLNAPIFRVTPFYRIGPARQAWIQLVKRSPLNLRPLFGQKREVVAKGLALFAVGAWRLAERGGPEADLWRARGTALLDRLIAMRSPGFEEIVWGYPFPWQSRAFFQQRDEPNLICSVFGSAAFEERADGGDRTDVPAEVARFIARRLLRKDGDVTWITYTPATNTRIHNVNLLGAAHLAVEARRTGSAELRGPRPAGDGVLGESHPRRRRLAVRRSVQSGVGRQLPHGLQPRGARTVPAGHRRNLDG